MNTPLLELFKETQTIFVQKYSSAVSSGIFLDWGKILRMASASGLLTDVRFLIEAKEIDINNADANPNTRYTPLHLSVIKNKPEIAYYLLSKGAKSDIQDANQKTPIHYIEEKENKEQWYEIFNVQISEQEFCYLSNSM